MRRLVLSVTLVSSITGRLVTLTLCVVILAVISMCRSLPVKCVSILLCLCRLRLLRSVLIVRFLCRSVLASVSVLPWAP